MLNKWVNKHMNKERLGPDGGIVLLDDELPRVCRITIEKKTKVNNNYFAVTVVIYDRFLDTSYYNDLDDAMEALKTIKLLVETINEINKKESD